MKWTPAQLDAIEAREGSVLVSAAAGSGKTAVLVERIIRAVLDPQKPVSLDRMLIVTFTRAATFEMRARIENAINALLKDDPYNRYLLTQKQLLYSAKILTIDGFCSEFVRNYFYKLDIQRDFRVPDDGERDILINIALDNALKYFYSSGNEDFLDLVNKVCTFKSDKNLRDNILELYRFLCSLPFPDDWMKEKLALYDASAVEFSETPYFECITEYSEQCLLYCLELNSLCFEYLGQDDFLPEDKLDKIRAVLSDDFAVLNSLNACIMSRDWDSVYDSLSNLSFKRFPPIKGADSDKYKVMIMSNRSAYTAEAKKLLKLYVCDKKTVEEQTKTLYPVIRAFFECVRRFISEFRALKNEKNLLDFSDIEHLAIELLCGNNGGEITFTDISEEISREFDLIMVDEFQDINETQNLLFKAVSRDRNNLFVVGDVKQSIYGFRQANPEIFLNYKKEYSPYDRQAPDYPAKIILDRNFRSRSGIIEACNFIFSSIMSEKAGGIEYNDEEKLVCAAEYEENTAPNTELMLIDCSNLNAEEDETKLKLEACRVAEKILKLIYEEKLSVRDGDTYRGVTFADIAVLIRSPKGDTRRAATFSKVFSEYGIPVNSELKSNFFEQNEIKLILNLLRVIDNPVLDIPLLSVMMSPLFGFSADDMALIRSSNRKMPIYSAVKAYAERDEKCAELISFISRMRAYSATCSAERLIDTVLSATGFLSIASAMDSSAVKNIYLLLDYARSYGENGYKTLSSFIHYMDLMIERGTTLNSGADSDSEALNAVSIMSIHSSKGLEFPVCFLSCSSTGFNFQDVNSAMSIDNVGGIGIKYRDKILRRDTVQRRAVSMMLKDSRLSEEMRILYVALTRAKERLIVTSAVLNPQKYLQSLESKITSYPISPYVIKNASSFSDWLFMCALINPSCSEIRTAVKPDYTNYGENYKPWKIEICSGPPEFADKDDGNSLSETADCVREENEEFMKTFLSRVNFEYGYKPLETLPRKVSASQLSHKDNKIFTKILRKPDFLNPEKTGAEAGSAFHRFMQKCGLENARRDIEKELQRLCESGHLSEREKSLIDIEKAKAFLNGELIERVLKSESYFREYNFTVKINASDYNPDIGEKFKDNRIIMQGAVDLAFIENGEIVIADYKTDRVKDAQKLIELYRRQVELYKTAMEEIFNIKVKEIIIYSVHLNEPVSVPL